MNKVFALGVAAVLFSISAVGCQNTAEGAKQDAATDSSAVKNAADTAAINTKKATDAAIAKSENEAAEASAATKKAEARAASATEKAAKNIGDNLDARPKVKTAIINDTELNNTANEVHVEVQGGIMTLSGHVLTNEMKQRAGKIATKTLKEINSTDTLMNKLTVKSAN